MTFREIVTSGAGRYLVAREFEDAGIDLVANTAEEIHDVCVEAVKRLQGTWTSTPEDEELQRRFMTLFQPGDLNTYFKARIGAAFLRKYQHLLA